MDMVGADVEQLLDLSNVFRRGSQQLEQIAAHLNAQIGATEWPGDDGVRFRSDWSRLHRWHLIHVSQALGDASDVLRVNAAEQSDASSGSGSAGAIGAMVGGVAGSVFRSAVDALLGSDGIPNAGTSPDQVADWWRNLTVDEQRQYLTDNPSRIGGLDGIPVDQRFEANRTLIQEHVDRLRNDGASDDEIAHFESMLDDGRNILLFDPTGEGRIAEVFGDLRTADDIAIFVPGIGNDLNGYDPSDAISLRAEAGDDTASVYWLGYDTPHGPDDLFRDGEVLSPTRSISAGLDLGTFSQGIRTAGLGEVTLVAHSYGSVVAGRAAQHGLDVDRVMLIGSPGVSMDTAEGFNGASVYAMKNTNDPVPVGSVHGTDPTSPDFGATVIAGNGFRVSATGTLIGGALGGPKGAVVGGVAGGGLENHTNYLEPGTDSLRRIANVITASEIGADGMLRQRFVDDDGNGHDIWTGTF